MDQVMHEEWGTQDRIYVYMKGMGRGYKSTEIKASALHLANIIIPRIDSGNIYYLDMI